MEFGDAEKHSKACGTVAEPLARPEELWGEEVCKVVERRVEEIRRERHWVM